MDPDVVLGNIIKVTLAYQLGKLTAKEAADELSDMVLELHGWCWDGGYAPSWPQRPLTDREVGELQDAGHYP